MHTVYLSLGSNQGDKRDNLARALSKITLKAGSPISVSSLYQTEPWGFSSDDIFLNQAVEIETALSARDLLETLLDVERDLGRVRRQSEQYESRIIDIDILFYGKEIITFPDLIIPHPQISLRRFVLEPMKEIAPGFIDPVSGLKISTLLEKCPDPLKVVRLYSSSSCIGSS
ncbi:MAG TPA: 2-amino-4-hydroxy-6-hydroxymethyldihydropteridine diphosphokinase [Prolixibacteraceae bacterium]|nr:2-amino-4-hydroxy-6-hydroxymethyldihydropteridine diphosphokinase [Prolixibacteraceae bacterium]